MTKGGWWKFHDDVQEITKVERDSRLSSDIKTIIKELKKIDRETVTVNSSWYHTNVAIEDNRKYKPFTKQNIYTHKYKGKTVVGYICGGHEPE